jgi:general nucleoside transport system permease protein
VTLSIARAPDQKRPLARRVAMLLFSLLLALLIGAVFMLAVGVDPLVTYVTMLSGAFGSDYSLSETLVKATPLGFLALAVLLPSLAQFWNVGAEGQYAMGAFAGTGVALFIAPALPPGLVIPVMLLAAFVAGAIWGVIPALLKTIFKANEILTTLMMNYIAAYWLDYLVYTAWKDPNGFGFPGTAVFPAGAWIPQIFGRMHAGFFVVLVLAVVIWVVMERSRFGFELKVMGESLKTAYYSGFPVAKNIVLAMVISGGMAALAGLFEIAGIDHRLQAGFLMKYGFTALIIAWLARLNPLAVIPVAILYAGLSTGADQLQMSMGLPSSIATVLMGIILVVMLGSQVLQRYQLTFTVRGKLWTLPS